MAAPLTAATKELREKFDYILRTYLIYSFKGSLRYRGSMKLWTLDDKIITELISVIVAEWEAEGITDWHLFIHTANMTKEGFLAKVNKQVDTYLCEDFLVSHRARTVLN
ncbi:hypothetical protein L211DRAFT_851590 [Terfezia boudieri ATCC MYA-4762]|uniref:Uncharacterized protein n=1 Tax=Terfezia boudieri ATCC MYA-4762 TaxID=1051890 RepID=A0A3N4LHQ6_9PEZI|nr:hypothetical protein L211DRAFT_851590 [Terfezia boudieri ATCC MYA-4762]